MPTFILGVQQEGDVLISIAETNGLWNDNCGMTAFHKDVNSEGLLICVRFEL